MSSIEQRIADLEKRQQRVADIQEILNLKSKYSNCADGGWDRPTHDGVACAALFTEDGVWDGGAYGKYEGRAAIKSFFESLRGAAPFAFHTNENPLVQLNVNGDFATGEWHHILFIRSPLGAGKPATDNFCAAIYTDDFVRTPEGWRFKILRARAAFMAPFTEGWSKADHLHR